MQRAIELPFRMHTSRGALRGGTVALALLLAASGIEPTDRSTWWAEILPVIGVLALLWITRHRFPLMPVLHASIVVALAMLCVGAHYTFERVPLGEWLQQAFALQRNPYDRLGHVVQGVVPALTARELLVRTSPLAGSRWLPVLAIGVALAISAACELVEWMVAVGKGADAREFLGMQGDPWDAQWDMACALAGAVLGLALLSRLHDRALARLRPPAMHRGAIDSPP
jgi:putative membrane protein